MEDLVEEYFDEDVTVELTFEDGSMRECSILFIFRLERKDIFQGNPYEYIALKPIDDEDDDVLIYRYKGDENGKPTIENIESDEEYELAADRFETIMDDILSDAELDL